MIPDRGAPVSAFAARRIDSAAGRRVRPLLRGPWWAGPGAIGLALVLVPAVAPLVTNRDPDPLFQHSWWSPLARVPTETLLVGSIGLVLLCSTVLTMLIERLIRPLRRLSAVVAIGIVIVLTACSIGAWTIVASNRAATSATAIGAVLLGSEGRQRVAPQATRAIQLALGWPDPSRDGLHIRPRGTVPAGPFLVQTTEVLNENLSDEGSDVTVGTLVDPVSGSVEAAWFFGL